MSARVLREWPRAVAGAIVLAAVLVGIGLLVGSQALGSSATTTTTTTATTTVRQAAAATSSPALKAADRQITTLHAELIRTRHRLTVARRRLDAATSSSTHHTTHRR